jgi:hypothetical protein
MRNRSRSSVALRRLTGAAVAIVALALAAVIAIFAASELGGEVVVLRTRDVAGVETSTHLWVVDEGGYAWLRAGAPGSGWFARLEASPEVVVERGGELGRYRAAPLRTSEARERVHALMREKYGLADRLIDLSRDGSRSVAVRLEPLL